jgi:hypothetical protein
VHCTIVWCDRALPQSTGDEGILRGPLLVRTQQVQPGVLQVRGAEGSSQVLVSNLQAGGPEVPPVAVQEDLQVSHGGGMIETQI